MNRRAVDFLKDLIEQALAKIQTLDYRCDDGIFDFFSKVYLADKYPYTNISIYSHGLTRSPILCDDDPLRELKP